MDLPGPAMWPFLFLVAFAPELLSLETILTAAETPQIASTTTLAPSTPALARAGNAMTLVPAKSTGSKATEPPSGSGTTSNTPSDSTLMESLATEPATRTPGDVTPGPDTSTTPEASDKPPASPGKEPTSHSTATAQPSGGSNDETSLSQKPGLIAVICIFLSILLIGTSVILAKCCRAREPSFKKLDEVPMGSVTEDSPFARYPPK